MEDKLEFVMQVYNQVIVWVTSNSPLKIYKCNWFNFQHLQRFTALEHGSCVIKQLIAHSFLDSPTKLEAPSYTKGDYIRAIVLPASLKSERFI